MLLFLSFLVSCGEKAPEQPVVASSTPTEVRTEEPEVVPTPTATPTETAEFKLPEDLESLRPTFEKIYEDMAFLLTTRDMKALEGYHAVPFLADGEEKDQAGVRAMLEGVTDNMKDLEEEAGVPLRFGYRSELLKLEPKEDEKVAVHGRFTLTARNIKYGSRLELKSESVDVWTRGEDGKWRTCETYGYKDLGEEMFHSNGARERRKRAKPKRSSRREAAGRAALEQQRRMDQNRRLQQLQEERLRQHRKNMQQRAQYQGR